MTCNHNLDEINCPICRISNHTNPESLLRENLIGKKPLFLKNQLFKDNIDKNLHLKEKILNNSDRFPKLNNLNPIEKITFLNEIPVFKNKMFLERLKEIDLKNPDKFGISKKIALESPEWKFNYEETIDKKTVIHKE